VPNDDDDSDDDLNDPSVQIYLPLTTYNFSLTQEPMFQYGDHSIRTNRRTALRITAKSEPLC
jgi:hypothetical protein